MKDRIDPFFTVGQVVGFAIIHVGDQIGLNDRITFIEAERLDSGNTVHFAGFLVDDDHEGLDRLEREQSNGSHETDQTDDHTSGGDKIGKTLAPAWTKDEVGLEGVLIELRAGHVLRKDFVRASAAAGVRRINSLLFVAAPLTSRRSS